MSMLAPMDEPTLEAFHEEQAKRRLTYVVGLVDPAGIVRDVVLAPNKDGANSDTTGTVPAEFIQGEPMLTKYGKDKGWTMLKTRCEQDGCPEKYDAWLQTVRARMQGIPIELPRKGSGFDMSAIYPPSVLEQQQTGGAAQQQAVKFVPGKGLVPTAKTDEKAADRRTRIAKLAQQMGLEEQSDAEA